MGEVYAKTEAFLWGRHGSIGSNFTRTPRNSNSYMEHHQIHPVGHAENPDTGKMVAVYPRQPVIEKFMLGSGMRQGFELRAYTGGMGQGAACAGRVGVRKTSKPLLSQRGLSIGRANHLTTEIGVRAAAWAQQSALGRGRRAAFASFRARGLHDL